MRWRTMLTVAAVLAVAASACGGDDDGAAATTSGDAATSTTAATATNADTCGIDNLELVTPGTLTVATGEPAFPPWVLDDDPAGGEGFEAAVVYAVANAMGFSDDQVTWIRTDFNEAIAPGPKDFDFNIQQYSISDERDEVVDFSDGYYTVKQALVAFADSPVAAATTVGDLAEFRLGAQIGTTSLDYIEDVIQPTTPASVYDTNADAKSAIDAQQVDALVFDLPTAFFITAVEMPDTAIVGQFETPGEAAEELGMLFADGNPLVECVNVALAAATDDGTLAALEEQYLANGGDIPTITP
ncbi:MAG: amino acid ABC transporter substrate-binding protein [Acidimicrobiia bacterium]|nr:amino acid ABC transporter substrate-binding protein [Acidimicrobiia bacterium]